MRFRSIDLLRTIAILIMITVHFLENLAGVVPALAGLGAPTFIFLSGVSYHLWLGAQARRGVPEREITRRTLRRGLFLFVVGLLFNVVVWLPEDILNWDVLTLIGSGLVALAGARHLDSPFLAVPCLLVLAVTPGAQVASEWELYWEGPFFDPDWTVQSAVLGYLVLGYFPLLPWIVVPVLGLMAGRLVFPERGVSTPGAKRLMAWGAAATVAALGLNQLGLAAPWLRERGALGGWRVTLPSLEYLVGILGTIALALGIAALAFDRGAARERPRAEEGGWSQVVNLWSRSSFTVYLLHHVAHVWPLWLYGLWSGASVTAYWRKAVSPIQALCLAAAFVLLAHVFLRILERRGATGIEGLMRRFSDRPRPAGAEG
jgi:uncharacterized membrane protein